MPTRVIELFGSGGDFPRLKEIDPTVRGKYAALSYCWGPPSKLTKTTPSTFSQYHKYIPFNELSRTPRDAIVIARQLGFQYLWIDALCIIQDEADKKDWATEAAKMAQYYENASLVIAASRAESSHSGVLQRRNLRVSPQFAQHKCAIREVTVENPAGYLANRAWTFQEQTLSGRTLFYAERSIHWQCAGADFEEMTWSEIDTNTGSLHMGNTIFDKRDLMRWFAWGETASGGRMNGHSPPYFEWYRLVENYSTKTLTFVGDRLPALAGLANRFHNPLVTGDYLAGLWTSDIVGGLMWYTKEPRVDCKEYVAPTWSWASTMTSIKYDSQYENCKRDPKRWARTWAAQLLSQDMKLSHSNSPFLGIRSGSNIVLSTLCRPILLFGNNSQPGETSAPQPRYHCFLDQFGRENRYFAFVEGKNEENWKGPVYVLLALWVYDFDIMPSATAFALIVEPAKHEYFAEDGNQKDPSDVYRRIGMNAGNLLDEIKEEKWRKRVIQLI
ncbi:putative heterokaryon incompatibility [Phaeomoniella chlamydospora]|uniref:Putative heterokaryon incompatibility n=1 Tax=Phaeomoniella chlamydospora TaxID=158046 RepID=A0A0G2G4S1_PHACM|nr:putative heterokaryon incompatibility [Phaeomoniella chlamydospora]